MGTIRSLHGTIYHAFASPSTGADRKSHRFRALCKVIIHPGGGGGGGDNDDDDVMMGGEGGQEKPK